MLSNLKDTRELTISGEKKNYKAIVGFNEPRDQFECYINNRLMGTGFSEQEAIAESEVFVDFVFENQKERYR